MPRTPGELAVWLGCIGMEVGALLSTFKSVVPSVVDLDFKTLYVYLPLKTPRSRRTHVAHYRRSSSTADFRLYDFSSAQYGH